MNTTTLIKGLTILAIYIALAVFLAGFLIIVFELTTHIRMSILFAGFIATATVLYVVYQTVDLVLKEVEGNDVLLTTSIINPRTLPSGQTLYNAYRNGFHFLWWWERQEKVIKLETIAKAFEFKVSTKDDDVQVVVQYDIEPDASTDESLSLYALNGKDAKDIEKNIVLRVSTIIQREVESFLSAYNSDKIIKNSMTESGLRVIDSLQKNLDDFIPKEVAGLGIRVRKVRLGNIDYSQEVSAARNDIKIVRNRIRAAKILAGKKGQIMSEREALDFILVDNGKAKKSILDIKAPEGFTGLMMGPGSEELLGGATTKKKK